MCTANVTTRLKGCGRAGQHAVDQRNPGAARRKTNLLGFENYAQVSLAPDGRQAGQCWLLRDMAARAKPFAERDRAER